MKPKNTTMARALDVKEEKLLRTAGEQRVPSCLHRPLADYVMRGLLPSTLLAAWFENDLMGGVLAADQHNRAALPEILRWIHCETPSQCHGSESKVHDWMDTGGMRGRWSEEGITGE